MGIGASQSARRLIGRPRCFAALVVLFGGAQLRADEPKTEVVREFPYGQYIYHVSFSPDGKWVVTDDQMWDAATGKKVRTLPVHLPEKKENVPFNLVFSPDGRTIAIHRYDDLWVEEAATGKYKCQVPLPPRRAHYSMTPQLAFTPDGQFVVTARNDEGLVRVYSLEKGREVRGFEYEPAVGGKSGAPVPALAVLPGGKRLFVHSHENLDRGGLVLLDLETGEELARHRFSKGTAWVDYSVLAPDGKHVFYTTHGTGLHRIELESGKEVRRYEAGGEYVYSPACSADGKSLAAAILDNKDAKDTWIQVWDVATGKTVRRIQVPKTRLGTPTFSPDGKLLLTTVDEKSARLWRVGE
jgi:WD40 repeat protein